MPLWQTGWRSRHARAILQTGWRSRHERAILQTRQSHRNSPSPAQCHRPPRLGKSKHSISAGTHRSLKGRRQETWRHDAHPMARWKKRHLGRHRHRYHRRLLSPIYTSRQRVRAARRKGRPAERRLSTQHSTTRTPSSSSLSKPTDQSTTRAPNSFKN